MKTLCSYYLVAVGGALAALVGALVPVSLALALSALLSAAGLDVPFWAVWTVAAGLTVCSVMFLTGTERGDSDDDGERPRHPAAPPARPAPLKRVVVPRGLTQCDTLGEGGIPSQRLDLDLGDVSASSFVPHDADSLVSRVIETREGPVLFIVARGSTAVERAAGAHHALVTGAPRIPVTSN